MRLGEYVQAIVGLLIGIFGLIITVGAVMAVFDTENPPEEGLMAHLALTLAFGIFPMVVSLFIAVRISQRIRRRRVDEIERQIFDLAKSHGGQLTPIQLAHGTSLTLEEAKAELDRLHLAGHCQTDIDDTGNLLYLFPSLAA